MAKQHALYGLCTHVESRDWFSLLDVLHRLALSLLLWAWLLLTSPLAFWVYTARYCAVWHGPLGGVMGAVLYPVAPLLFGLLVRSLAPLSPSAAAGYRLVYAACTP